MIGIFGGTFDPVHYGHIKPALSVKQALNLSQLRFIPNRVPPHRETPWLPVEQRLVLLKTALQDYPNIMVDERELKREGPSYMIDTLKSLKQDFPDESLCLIIGMDAYFGIPSWFQWRDIFELCQLVVTTRPGFEQSEIKQQMDSDDYDFLARKVTANIKTFTGYESSEKLMHDSTKESAQVTGQILLQSVPQLDISSTQIRENVLKNENISQWMPAQAYQKLRGFINDN